MKIKISFKDPDALHDCIDTELEDLKIEGLNEKELEVVREKRKEEITDLCAKWFEYGEYLVVEVDTEKETCEVMPVL